MYDTLAVMIMEAECSCDTLRGFAENLWFWVGTYWLGEPVNAVVFATWLFVFSVASAQVHRVAWRKSKGKLLYDGDVENYRFFRAVRVWATLLLIVDVAWTVYIYLK